MASEPIGIWFRHKGNGEGNELWRHNSMSGSDHNSGSKDEARGPENVWARESQARRRLRHPSAQSSGPADDAPITPTPQSPQAAQAPQAPQAPREILRNRAGQTAAQMTFDPSQWGRDDIEPAPVSRSDTRPATASSAGARTQNASDRRSETDHDRFDGLVSDYDYAPAYAPIDDPDASGFDADHHAEYADRDPVEVDAYGAAQWDAGHDPHAPQQHQNRGLFERGPIGGAALQGRGFSRTSAAPVESYPSVFDRAPRAGLAGGLGPMINLAAAVVSVGLVLGLGVWSYRVLSYDADGIPIIRAMDGPMRIAPDNPGGDTAAHQGLAVNSVAAEGEAEAPPERLVLAPKPETLQDEDLAVGQLPVFEDLSSQFSALDPSTIGTALGGQGFAPAPEVGATGTETAAPVQPGRLGEAPTLPGENLSALTLDTGLTPAPDADALPQVEPATGETRAPDPVPDLVPESAPDPVADPGSALASAPVPGLAPGDASDPAAIALALAAQLASEPAALDTASDSTGITALGADILVSGDAALGVIDPFTNAIRVTPPASAPNVAFPPARPRVFSASAPVAPPVTEIAEETLQSGVYLAQLGTFASDDLARAEWARLSVKHVEIFGTKSLVISTATSGGQVFYRLRGHGFDGAEDVKTFCSVLEAQGSPCVPTQLR